MSFDCRLFAVPEVEINALLANPAIVIGRLALEGSPICELPDVRQTFSLLLSSNPGKVDETGISLLTGGTELGVLQLAGALPRLLDLREVKLLNASLQRLSGVEVQRRFQQQCVGTAAFGPNSGETTIDWEDAALGPVIGSFEDEWSLDQAEDFERVATQIESLKVFVAQTTGRRESLVIALQDSD